MIEDAAALRFFSESFGGGARWIARAPGRVNLIGEHTDYNGGFVMPAAIDREVKIAAAPRADHRLALASAVYGERHEVDLSAPLAAQRGPRWADYALAVFELARPRGLETGGWNLAILGDVPPGAGLSSSAAFEVCVATLLNEVAGAPRAAAGGARWAQAAGPRGVGGVGCGIMDQMASALGREDAALRLDCHTLECAYASLDPRRASLLIFHTGKERGLVDSEYNQRRADCERALEALRRLGGGDWPTLRHVPEGVLALHGAALDPAALRRARHNLTENRRVLEFERALTAGDFARAGALLYESHRSLRDDYEVSSAELDLAVKLASALPGVWGCRMTGAGFGGCCIALVQPERADEIAESLARRYEARAGRTPRVFLTRAVAGAGARQTGSV